jgi:hypothetical protein
MTMLNQADSPPQQRRSGCGSKKMVPFLSAADEVVVQSQAKNSLFELEQTTSSARF